LYPPAEARKHQLEIIRELAHVLLLLHAENIGHGDLNPKNILINDTGAINLIDFGYNFSLTRPVLSAQAHRAATRYIAPSTRTVRDAFDDDLYALSILIIDIWYNFQDRDPFDLLDMLSIDFPDLALLLEDSLAPDEQLRFAKFENGDKSQSSKAQLFYAGLDFALARYHQRDEDPSLFALFASELNIFQHLEQVQTGSKAQFIEDPRTNNILNFYFRLATVGTPLCFATVLYLLFADTSTTSQESWIFFLRQKWSSITYTATSNYAQPGYLIPGYLICLSFLSVAVYYYCRLFASVVARHDTRLPLRIANCSMRLNSFCFLLPIIYCFVFDPGAWPFCAALGVFFVACNNWLVGRALSAVRDHSNFPSHALSRSTLAKQIYHSYIGWDRIILYYALGLVIVGATLVSSSSATNVMVDKFLRDNAAYNIYEWLCALLVVAINFLKMQRENCGTAAPSVRSMIQRHFEAERALEKYEYVRD